MVFKKLVVVVGVFVIFVGGAFTAYQVGDVGQNEAARENQTKINESITQQVGIYQLVDEGTAEYTAGFSENVTVYNSANTELEKGTDYEWNASDGTIQFKSTADVTDGNSAKITYVYYQNTQEVRDVSGPLSTITGAIGQSGFLAAGFALILFIIVFGAFVATKLTKGAKTNR